jgi:hypothetical protein
MDAIAVVSDNGVIDEIIVRIVEIDANPVVLNDAVADDVII